MPGAGSPSTGTGCCAATASRPEGASRSTRGSRRRAAAAKAAAAPAEADEPVATDPTAIALFWTVVEKRRLAAVERQRGSSVASTIDSAPWRRRSPSGSPEQARSSRDQPEALGGKGESHKDRSKQSARPEPSATQHRPKPKAVVKPKGKAVFWGQGQRAFQTEAGPVLKWRKTKRGKAENRSERSKRDRIVKGTLYRTFGTVLGKAESKVAILRRKLGERLPSAKSKAGWKAAAATSRSSSNAADLAAYVPEYTLPQ